MKSLLVLAVVAIGAMAQAQTRSPIGIGGTPIIGGTGCPNGSAQVTITEDAQTLSILFDKFVADAPVLNPDGSLKAMFDRKACNVRIPIRVDAGYQVAMFAVDYQGFAAIPAGGYGRLEAVYSYVGQQVRKPKFIKTFGPGVNNYSFKNELVSTTYDFTPCSKGMNLMLTIDANILANTTTGEAAQMSVDSLDLVTKSLYSYKAPLYFGYRYQRCN